MQKPVMGYQEFHGNVNFQFCTAVAQLFSKLDQIFFQQESRKLNYEQVVEEDHRLKLPNNYDLKRKRQEWELKEMVLRKVELIKPLDDVFVNSNFSSSLHRRFISIVVQLSNECV